MYFKRGQPIGQRWLHKKPLVGGVCPQAEDSLDHLENAAGCPCLGNIGPARIERGKIKISLALQACEDFRRSIRIKTLDGIKHATNDEIRLISQAVTLKACRDNAVVMRPDGAALVGEWVIGGIVA